MKRFSTLIVTLTLLLAFLTVSFAWAQTTPTEADANQDEVTREDGDEGTTDIAPIMEETETIPGGPPKELPGLDKPMVSWGDYDYYFTSAVFNYDIDPQSDIINRSYGSYVHVYITVDWKRNNYPLEKAPLHLILHCPNGQRYKIFGKDNFDESYIWRSRVRYPSIPGEYRTRIFVTFNARGTNLGPNFDMNHLWLEVNGYQEVWNWLEWNWQYNNVARHITWWRDGSAPFNKVHLANIYLREMNQ